MLKRNIILASSATIALALSVGVLFMWTPVTFPLSTAPEIVEPNASDQPASQLIPAIPKGIVMRPPPQKLAPLLRSLGDVQRDVPATIKEPSYLPGGFSLKGVIVWESGKMQFEGKMHDNYFLELVYWDKPVTANTVDDELLDGNGLFVSIVRRPGNVTLEGFQRSISPVEIKDGKIVKVLDPPAGVSVRYLWGNPAIVSSTSIELSHQNSQLMYRVYGNHPSDVLMSVMDSIVNG